MNKEQTWEIEKNYAHKYCDPNVFLKVRLFIFTLLAAGFSIGTMSIFFVGIYENNINSTAIIQSLMIGSVFFFLLENLIKGRQCYHSGADSALIYMALGAFCTTIYFLFEKKLLLFGIF